MVPTGVYASNVDEDTVIITHSEEISEEQYVESLANQLNISYEEAYKINRQENEKYLPSGKVQPFGLDEIIAYKTVYGSQRISGTPNYVEIAAEIKYVYSYTTGKAIEIMSVGAPYMYIRGITADEIDGGDFNIERTRTTARISRTASFVYITSKSLGISVGGDVISVDASGSKNVIVTTRARIYVMNVRLSDL